jgi:hypothetical protein
MPKLFYPPPYKPVMYATYISSRIPKWKIHTAKGHATNAIQYDKKAGGVMYELVDGEWQEFRRIEGLGTQNAARPRTCPECEQTRFFDPEDYLCLTCRG